MDLSRPSGQLSDFVAPREVEHPVLPLTEASARPLMWVQPQPMRPAYELWAGESVVATLRYRGLQRREALGCAAEGIWTIQADELEPTIHISTVGRDVGRFDTARRVLWLPGGERYVWAGPLSESGPAAFRAADGLPVVTFTSELAPQARLRVDVGGSHQERVTLLAILGCYHLLAERTVRVAPAVLDTPYTRPTAYHRS